jgi:glucose-1-phosphate cytidylyltransferase
MDQIMQAMILAGGYGSRISEESAVRPKPMVEIGEMPILWHIMKIYSSHGINDFVICCGYKGHVIKEWFTSYVNRRADITIDFRENTTTLHSNKIDPWRVTLVDTGEKTMTGGRIRRAAKYLEGPTFCMTYGDGVSNVDITASVAYHKEHGKKVTMTAVQPDQRFGIFPLGPEQQLVTRFREKPKGEGVWANAGYFVLDRSVVDYIDGDDTVWEVDPMQRLAEDNEVVANRHQGFWMPMDTLRDKNVLEEIWASGNPPWKMW